MSQEETTGPLSSEREDPVVLRTRWEERCLVCGRTSRNAPRVAANAFAEAGLWQDVVTRARERAREVHPEQ